MAFSNEQLRQLLSAVSQKLSSGKLNDWELRFLSDMQAKLEKNQHDTVLTEKQLDKLYQLADIPIPQGPLAPSTRKKPTRRVNLRTIKGGRSKNPSSTSRTRHSPSVTWRRKPHGRRGRNFGSRRFFGRTKLIALSVIAALALMNFLIFDDGSLFDGLSTTSFSSAARYNEPREISSWSVKVIDGDTVKVSGESSNVRLLGFNTPETYRYKCSKELELGERATKRLKELLRSADTIQFERKRCACRPGTERTNACNFGRICGTLRTDGRDVGRTLISEGLAVRFVCGQTSCPPLPANWCS